VQTGDGYLWLGTGGGIVRFDGNKFSTFNGNNNPASINNIINALFEDNNGDLWIGTLGSGLVIYKNGKFKNFSEKDGFLAAGINNITGGSDGAVWIGTNGSGLYRYRDNRFINYTTKDGLPGDVVMWTHSAGSGEIWVATLKGFCHFKEDTRTFTPYNIDTQKNKKEANEINTIFLDSRWILWIGTSAGLYRMQDGKPIPAAIPPARINTIYEDRNNTLWIGTRDQGIFHYKDGKFSGFTNRDRLNTDRVYSIIEDTDGGVWVGTLRQGLHCLSPPEKNTFGLLEVPRGAGSSEVWAVCESSGGYLWIGTYNGLFRSRGQELIPFTTGNGLSRNVVFTVYEDRNRFIWVGTERGLNQLENSAAGISVVKQCLLDYVIYAVLVDAGGNLWAGSGQSLLLKTKDSDNFDEKFTAPISGIYEDSEKNVWVSTLGAGLIRFQDGVPTIYNEKNHLPGDFVNSLYQDGDSVYWIATTDGLSRFKNGGFTNYNQKNGLFTDHLCQV
ncbi:MAG: hypothetical protein GY950_24405, partial [bacterium]|nr:hypothetical protein [bacterium]